jgi:hypothetical protein
MIFSQGGQGLSNETGTGQFAGGGGGGGSFGVVNMIDHDCP